MENDLKLGIVGQSHFSGADATPHLSLQLSEGPSVREQAPCSAATRNQTELHFDPVN